MKNRILLATLGLLCCCQLLLANTYTTSFPATENPISQSSSWTNGLATGLDWSNVRTTTNLAFGTQSGVDGFNDSIAVLTGSWGPTQTAQATVHTINQTLTSFEEVELLLRFSITAHSATGYEFTFGCRTGADAYVQINRWNGAFGNYTPLDSRTGPGIHNGDTVKATISGSLMTIYVNGSSVFTFTDSTFASGNPGIGFYFQEAGPSVSDYGLTDFTVTDGISTVTSASGRMRLHR